MKKLYCVSLRLNGKFPIGFRPTADEHLSIEVGGSTLAYPKTELQMGYDCRTEIQTQGWGVVCTDMDRKGLRFFLDRNVATVRTIEGEVELEDVVTVYANDQMLVVDLDAMNAEVHHV